MLLATKCPYCKTTFKVANDQLKLQSGLVRCGICHQVFNGIEHLAQADTAAGSIKINPPEPATATISDVTATEDRSEPTIPAYEHALTEPEPDLFEALEISTESGTRVEPVLDMPNLVDTFFSTQATVEIAPELQDETAPAETEQAETVQTETLPDASVEEIILSESDRDLEPEPFFAIPNRDALMEFPADVIDREAEQAVSDQDKASDDEDLAHLLFIRQAKSRKRLRWLLTVGTLLLLLSLTGQVVYQFRDYLAAAYPQTRGTLITLCRLAHCQVRLPAQLDAISYEADELHSLAHENTFEFSLLMRNHATLPQAWPDIELTLKDNKKQVVLRRVFQPFEYLATPQEELNGFQPGQEQAVKLYFVVNKVKATDYVVSIFYP